MHLTDLSLLLLPFLASRISALLPSHHARATPRSLDALLVGPREPTPSSSPSLLSDRDLWTPVPTVPYLRHLDLRQVAPVQPAANAQIPPAANAQVTPAANAQVTPAANAQVTPAANAKVPPAANAQVPPAANAEVPPAEPVPVAPVAGVGGGGAAGAAQPAPGTQVNPVTTVNVETVIGGVTTVVPGVFTQNFGLGPTLPPVETGSIGMGTLTGEIGVVRTDQAKNGAISTIGERSAGAAAMGILACWLSVMAVGGGIIGIGVQ
ncbi:MAG: hypothetical protein Q9163_004951 [Psora crenata]